METGGRAGIKKELPSSTKIKQNTLVVKLPVLTEKRKRSIGRSKKDASVSSLSNESASDDILSQESSLNLGSNNKKGSSTCNKPLYPLRPSLFASVPPYLNFTLSSDRMKKLPKRICSMLRWKVSSVTSPLITKIVKRSGFTLTNDENLWVSVWRRQIKCLRFREMEENQKLNHFPGTFHLGHKDKLWLNIVRMQEQNGKKQFSFMPQTFILPQDIVELRESWKKTRSRSRWIIKPPSSARGNEIVIVHRWEDIPEGEPVIVQRYIIYPYLINDTKFDLRLYVLVTSFDPLRLYVYEDGLVRFATENYSKSLESLSKNGVYLTNCNANGSNSSYKDKDQNFPQGHEWSLKALWSYFRQNGVDDRKIWQSLVDVVIKTMISCEDPINKLIKTYAKNRYCCYELFSFDLILDYALKPWLLEVKLTPNLQTRSQLDSKIKGALVKDMLNTAGFHIPKECKLNSITEARALQKIGINPQSNISWNKVLYDCKLSYEERIKQFKFRIGISSQVNILKDLTPDDVRQLIQSEDELKRCGQFTRIFPTETSFLYLKFFENIKYHNLLLSEWERKHHRKRKQGIAYLQSYCEKGFHLLFTDSIEDDVKYTKANKSKQTPLDVKVECTSFNSSPGPVANEDVKAKKPNDDGSLLPVTR